MKVLVIGGGISGLFLSYYLLKSGSEVVVADSSHGVVNTSANNAGQLSTRPSFTDIFAPSSSVHASPAEMRGNKPWFELARRQSEEDYEAVATDLATKSMGLYDEFFARERPKVDLARKVLDLRSTRRGAEPGSPVGRHLDPRELSELGYKGFEEGWLIEEKSLHSRKLVDFLIGRVLGMGAKFERGEVRLKSARGRVSRALVDGRPMVADAYVVAGGSWCRKICAPLGYDPMVVPARGLALFYDTGGKRVVDHPAHYEDEGATVTQHDKETLRFTSFFDLVGFNPRFSRRDRDWLFEVVSSHFSRRAGLRLTEIGVGYRPSTPDQLPVVGRIPRCENAYVLTGSCRKGMTLAPILGQMLTRLMLQGDGFRDSSLAALDPGRFETGRALPKF